jgi:RNA polymerase sigma factor (TIGR02999 family)
MSPSHDITVWLGRMSDGDPEALDRVVRLLYGELRRLASAKLRNEREGHTLAATALVNEVYLKLSSQRRIRAEDRTQFMAVAATTMRRVLVDYARARRRDKRGGGAEAVPFEDVEPFLSERESDEVLALDAAIDRLAVLNDRAARVVVQRFYAGFSVEETAALLDVSSKTVQRDWITARAWLRKEVARELGTEPGFEMD